MDNITCAWKVKLLFSTAGAHGAPTILHTKAPAAADPADEQVGAVLATLKQALLREAGERVQARDRTRLTVGEIAALTGTPPFQGVLESFTSTYGIFAESTIAKAILASPSIDFMSTVPDWHHSLFGTGAAEWLLQGLAKPYPAPLFEAGTGTATEDAPDDNPASPTE
ncbi:hypothetical protein ACFWOG_12425 [Kitasatospora sp. NPDC058406]|uniref:hypothetical protein n=1 Tax=Kitasatospora sp. NPDC058406 TaxID=3346483 RepID=UPI00364F4854